jgi:putative transposase
MPNVNRIKMHLSKAGVLADVFWHEIINHAKNVELDAFVVMPNHIHGILILNPPDVETGHALSSDKQETRHALSLRENQPAPLSIAQQRFRNQGKNTISSIIGSYKSAVTKHANRMGFKSSWQTRFHDHVISSDESYINIVKYIESNVANWEGDKFFS